MTVKEKLLERAPGWSEQQAKRALLAAERDDAHNAAARRAGVLERAAGLQARQHETVDAAALVREARGELEQRVA